MSSVTRPSQSVIGLGGVSRSVTGLMLARLASELHHRWVRCLETLGKNDTGLPTEGPLDFTWHLDARDKLNLNDVTWDESEGSLELQPHLRVVSDFRALKATAAVDQDLDSYGRCSLDSAAT